MASKQTFFFYDTETSGFSARTQRIMQFAGQRTDLDLKPIGEPINVLIKLTEEILPDPEATLVHGITPQKTLEEGYSEAEFAKLLYKEVLKPGTIMVGFNNIRFDDEFIRHTLYRNFHDAYEWHWQDGRSRWDVLDMARMMRALRPDGIKWPFDNEGKPANNLERLAVANGIAHSDAHDALADVQATLELAKIIKSAQPKLFDWLLSVRDKKEAAKLVNLDDPKPFVYTSGIYSSKGLKTSIAFPVAPNPDNPSAVLVYDLRHNPGLFIDMPLEELKGHAFLNRYEREEITPLPVKSLALNRCPAIAPLGVLDDGAQERIKLTIEEAQTNLKKLIKDKTFGDKVRTVWEEHAKPEPVADVDFQLYDGFIGDKDKKTMSQVRSKSVNQLADYQPKFEDKRLEAMLLRYKARNYPKSLSAEEEKKWQSYRSGRILNGLPGQASLDEYFKRIEKLSPSGDSFLLEQLKLYGELLAPTQTLL